MATSVSDLSFIQQMLTRYGMSTYVAFGNFGNLLAIATFCQCEQRKNPCSLYLLSMTKCNLICLDVGIIPTIFALDHVDISTQSIIYCKLQFYIRHAFFQMMRTYKVLACMDRYAISSTNVHIRSLNTYKMAIYLIITAALFWLLAVIFFSYARRILNGSCNIQNGIYLMIYTIYYMLSAGLFPPLLIVFFNTLLIRNLKGLRSRIQPIRDNAENKQSNNMLRKRDRDLMKMNFVEVMIYIIILQKSLEQQQIESFINYLTQSFLMYLNTAMSFYIYTLTSSSSFRQECKRVLFKFYALIMRKQLRNLHNNSDRTMTIHN
ncbi:unnamed protein product [Rotaria magnacalcarata]|uniref:G-protein coupled receptors family 1 profile domain-containing protein n=1 Tax=Rotaria magnacalcarata TaxID=392030 RepID=A0A816L1P7_9BILA|nr:unnamed protein product [Rotaria magnacalcarata]CAF1537174.1 unnamed protein product [Rotaria magnacalcarata]CAF1928953.1 unnamed protein product [Rotaria magnacalcarata]CAF3805896.1 unnamed protein product [Rotaria magnacalcarata]CAF3812907.1 unnamed protein product [Rotaria magnacalcarata]